MNVGELTRSIQKPISIYVDEVVQALQEKLHKDLSVAKCSTPEDCNHKIKPRDLCKSCKSWFDKINDLHENSNNPKWRDKTNNNPSWHKNCKSAKWSEDHWEVAKFFMSALGSNLSTVKDAESTDISSLLNVLEWLTDRAFLGKTRVNVDLVRDLRSEVRNTWAHAPQHELSDDEMAQGFSIATEFLEDLENVWSHAENGKCLEYLKDLKTSRVTNVAESELQNHKLCLLLQSRSVDELKEEIIKIKDERSSDKNVIAEHEQKLKNLERTLDEFSQRMSKFESGEENMNIQFNNFAEDLKSFRAISDDIHEIRNCIGQIRDDLAKMNKRQKEQREPASCLPDRLPNFTARAAEVQKVITFLMNEEKAVVSLHGGPGFGKTAIAIEVSHKLSKDHDIPVVYSQLTTATNVDEMIGQLCLDVGVNHEDEDEGPKSSLILWLKNMKSKVIFVMDDIDNLLKDTTRSAFYQFVQLLRKNSNQHCQIVTTSRTAYEIRELVTGEVNVEEMDVEACMQLMRKQCPEQDDAFLQRLAELCGKIPLAMCVAGSRVDDFEDTDELLQHLQEQPMKTLECPESDEYVYRAINMSYKKCSDEEKETLVRLAVLKGSFSEEAAKAVIEKSNLDTKRVLKNLFSRSLIKQPTKHRYSIHLLIKRFLIEQQNGEDETAERAKAQAMRAELLMVKYYLKLGLDLTMKSYSKDKYKVSREDLKKEAHNIQNVLKICCQQSDPTTSDISDCLAQSKVYTTSARHFSLFIRTIIAGCTIDKFLQRCADMAQERKQHAIKINFDCLLADQERIKSLNGLNNDFDAKMEEIRTDLETHHEDSKKDKSLWAHYYQQYGRYLLRKCDSEKEYIRRLDVLVRAREQFEQSLRLRQQLPKKPVEIADRVYSLLQLGNICKKIATTEFHLEYSNRSEDSTKQAEEYYNEAIKLSKENLGEHELTSWCHKYLGDLFLQNKKSGKAEKAEKEFTDAKEMQESLGLNANKMHVSLLNNLGQCLTINGRVKEGIEILKSACDIAENLAENDDLNGCKAKVYKSLAIEYDSKGQKDEAVYYAKKALEFEEAINQKPREKLRKIVSNNISTK